MAWYPLHELDEVAVDVRLVRERQLWRFFVGAFHQPDAGSASEQFFNIPFAAAQVGLDDDAQRVARSVDLAEKAQRALGVGGAFHIDAHKIVVTRGALGDRGQEPARLLLVNPESKLSELHRNMGPQPFPVEPVEQAQIDAASFLSRCRFGHALAQVVQRGLEPLVIQPVAAPTASSRSSPAMKRRAIRCPIPLRVSRCLAVSSSER